MPNKGKYWQCGLKKNDPTTGSLKIRGEKVPEKMHVNKIKAGMAISILDKL